MSYANINKNACSAGCYCAMNWTGMTTNADCRCLNDINLGQRRQVRLAIQAYREKIRELENELADRVIEEELYEEQDQ